MHAQLAASTSATEKVSAGRIAKASLALLLVVIATLTALGLGAAPAHAMEAAPAHAADCTPKITPIVSGLEVAGPKAPTGSSELGVAIGSSSIHSMRTPGAVPAGPHGYHALLAGFVKRALAADPSGC